MYLGLSTVESELQNIQERTTRQSNLNFDSNFQTLFFQDGIYFLRDQTLVIDAEQTIEIFR